MITEIARGPDGWVALRFPKPRYQDRCWILVYLNEDGDLSIQALNDDEVADWPRFFYEPEPR